MKRLLLMLIAFLVIGCMEEPIVVEKPVKLTLDQKLTLEIKGSKWMDINYEADMVSSIEFLNDGTFEIVIGFGMDLHDASFHEGVWEIQGEQIITTYTSMGGVSISSEIAKQHIINYKIANDFSAIYNTKGVSFESHDSKFTTYDINSLRAPIKKISIPPNRFVNTIWGSSRVRTYHTLEFYQGGEYKETWFNGERDNPTILRGTWVLNEYSITILGDYGGVKQIYTMSNEGDIINKQGVIYFQKSYAD